MAEIKFTLEGDINAGRGNFGFTNFTVLSSPNTILWNVIPQKPHRYYLSADPINNIVTLPEITVIPAEISKASIGHSVYIFNSPPTTSAITVNNSLGALVVLIPTSDAYIITAKSAPGTWVVSKIVNSTAGDVDGPGFSTDNAVVRWDGTTGKIIQNSGVILSDANSFTGVVDIGMSGDIRDANSNELINFVTTPAATNEVSITNAATGGSPQIGATGNDTNISLTYLSKGATSAHIFDNDTSAAEIRLVDNVGTDYIGIRPAATTTTYTLTMPPAQGAAGTVLQNNGSGILSWVANGGGGGALTTLYASSSVPTSTTSTSYVLLNSMNFITPAAGTWFIWFSASVSTDNGNRRSYFAVSINGGASVYDGLERIFDTGSATDLQAGVISGRVIVTGVENIGIYYKVSSNTLDVINRSLMAIKVS